MFAPWGHPALAVIFVASLAAPLIAFGDIVLPPPPPPPAPIAPTVTPITLSSNDASTTVAGLGNTVTLSFTSDQSAATTPTATIGGHSASVSSAGGNAWRATVTMVAGDIQGGVTFSADVPNAFGTATRTATTTTDGSSVYFDATAPVITLSGSATMSLTAGGSFNDPGASALDAHDGVVSVTTTGRVDTGVAGTYTLTYSASDAAGNGASTTRSVIVNAAPAPAPAPSGGGGGGGCRRRRQRADRRQLRRRQ